MTPKQRSKIYRKAAEELYNKPMWKDWFSFMSKKAGYIGICGAVNYTDHNLFFDDTPEGKLMEPDKCWSDTIYWYPNSAESVEPRILALLLCEQIALNP